MLLLKYKNFYAAFREVHNCSKMLHKKQPTDPILFSERGRSSMSYFRKGRKFTVAVEGNIGSGKSTLLEYFKIAPTVETFPEPVEKWTNMQGHNALKLLYEDPNRWSFMFNNYVMLSRLEIHKYCHMAPVKLMERSLHSTRNIFVENSFRSGALTHIEYIVLQAWFEQLFRQPETEVDLFVYLRVPPDICLQRIRTRNRKEESSISMDFLTNLHNLHEEWLIQKKQNTIPVLVLDAGSDMSSLHKLYEENRYKILCGCT